MSRLKMGAGGNVHESKFLLVDDFVVPTGSVVNHTPGFNPLTNAWESGAGTWTVRGDGTGLEHVSNDCEDVAVVDLGTPDVDITLITNPFTDEGDMGICFRYSALTAMYFYDYDTAGDQMRIAKFNPGASVIATNTGDPGAGELIWRVRAKGNLLEGWIENVANTYCRVVDSDLNGNTKHGIRHCLISANFRYKSIRVSP